MQISTITLLVIYSFFHVALSYRMVCVYTNWSQYRPDKGKFLPENVDPSSCTHLIYVYAKLKNNQLEPSEWNDDSTPWMEGMYSRVNSLKQMNPDLKTLLGVGGWKMGSKDFSRMASRKKSRELFARTAAAFLRDRDFDGLAIDWQYPTQRGGRKLDRKNFSLLLKEIKEAFEKESADTGYPQLLLVAGVGASKHIVDSAYEVDMVSNYTDFLNVMAYDLHGSWDNFTGHPSPLFPRKDETGPQAENNVDTLVKYWVSKGADPSKLVLGISTYGRTFTLKNKKFNGYGVPVIGPGEAGDYTKQEGMLAFYERCSLYLDATRVWDDYSKVPYWHSGQHWIGGEDAESIRAKVNWVYTNKLGGLMFWSLDTDDFEGVFCGDGDFPLINAAAHQFAAPVELNRPIYTTNETQISKRKPKPIMSPMKSSKKVINTDQSSVSELKGQEKVSSAEPKSVTTIKSSTQAKLIQKKPFRANKASALSKALTKSQQTDSQDRTNFNNQNAQGGGDSKVSMTNSKPPSKDKTNIVDDIKKTEIVNTQNVESEAKSTVSNSSENKLTNKPLKGNKKPNAIESIVTTTKPSAENKPKPKDAQTKSRKNPKPPPNRRRLKAGKRRRKQWRRRRPPSKRQRRKNNKSQRSKNKAKASNSLKSKHIKKNKTSQKSTTPATTKLQSSTTESRKVNWVRYNSYGGIMINPLDMDDFDGKFCQQGQYPLLTAIIEQLLAPLTPTTKPILSFDNAPETTTESISSTTYGFDADNTTYYYDYPDFTTTDRHSSDSTTDPYNISTTSYSDSESTFIPQTTPTVTTENTTSLISRLAQASVADSDSLGNKTRNPSVVSNSDNALQMMPTKHEASLVLSNSGPKSSATMNNTTTKLTGDQTKNELIPLKRQSTTVRKEPFPHIESEVVRTEPQMSESIFSTTDVTIAESNIKETLQLPKNAMTYANNQMHSSNTKKNYSSIPEISNLKTISKSYMPEITPAQVLANSKTIGALHQTDIATINTDLETRKANTHSVNNREQQSGLQNGNKRFQSDFALDKKQKEGLTNMQQQSLHSTKTDSRLHQVAKTPTLNTASERKIVIAPDKNIHADSTVKSMKQGIGRAPTTDNVNAILDYIHSNGNSGGGRILSTDTIFKTNSISTKVPKTLPRKMPVIKPRFIYPKSIKPPVYNRDAFDTFARKHELNVQHADRHNKASVKRHQSFDSFRKQPMNIHKGTTSERKPNAFKSNKLRSEMSTEQRHDKKVTNSPLFNWNINTRDRTKQQNIATPLESKNRLQRLHSISGDVSQSGGPKKLVEVLSTDINPIQKITLSRDVNIEANNKRGVKMKNINRFRNKIDLDVKQINTPRSGMIANVRRVSDTKPMDDNIFKIPSIQKTKPVLSFVDFKELGLVVPFAK